MTNLYDLCNVELTEGVNSEYIGITIYNGKPQVIFPRGYNLSDDKNKQRKDILLLIKVFDKYLKRRSSKLYEQNLKDFFEGEGSIFPFINALWLIRDYENNGLYNESIHNYRVDKKGVINWSKTIRTQNPYISNNRLVYLDFIVKEKRNDLNNVILLIQKYIIEKCLDNIGWLYPNVNIEKGNKLPYNYNTCINILKKELRLINIDNIKQLIINMIEFLKYAGKEKSHQKLKEYKTKYFMNIWEDMLSEVLGNENANEYYPNAYWVIERNTINASNLRPDIILKNKCNVYVIDAKYYKYGITGNVIDLPQSSDITKQLLYSEYIKSNYGNINAYDAFILPYEGHNDIYFKFVGNATINIDGFNEKKVVCILADTKKIMKQYVNMIDLDKSKERVMKIIDSQNKI